MNLSCNAVALASILFLGSTASPLDPPAPPNTVQPTPSTENRSRAAGWGERSWLDQHEDGRRFLKESSHPSGADLLLLGDSITQSFGGQGRRTGQPGREALQGSLPGLVVANQGISGDRTQHLIWRIRNGALANRQPRWIAVMIGTNNLPHDDAGEIALGIQKVVEELRAISPDSIVLLHAVPPRGVRSDDPMRKRADETNRIARTFADGQRVRWVDPWPVLLDEAGRPRTGFLAADGVHLGPDGYGAWAGRLKLELSRAPASDQDADQTTTEATEAVHQHARMPATSARGAMAEISARRLGARAPRPPTWIAIDGMLANPQSA